jgi:membrane protein YqaA with SNARE-associated domain
MIEYLIACLWSFAEATFFFFIPDIYLTRIALFDLRKALLACVFSAVSACVGGAVMYGCAELYPQQVMHFLTFIPAIFPKLINEVLQNISYQPFYSLVLAPLQGTPYKIYAAAFGAEQLNFTLFIVTSFFARLSRFLLVTLAGGLVVKLLSRYYKQDSMIYFHIYIWGIIYAIYFCSVVYGYF